MSSSVFGVEKVLLHLNKHPDCYVIIGGIATKTILEEKGFASRETKDFDIVLLADSTKKEFAEDITNLLKEGKYKNGFSNEKKICYRFEKPETNGYPKIIELFSVDNNDSLHHYLQKIDIVIDEERLSAIVLEKDVFDFIKSRRIISSDGLPVVDPLGLIVLKAHAYFKNLKLYQEGKIKGKTNYLKHRNDIINLLLSLNGDEKAIALPEKLKIDCSNFVKVLASSSQAYKSIAHFGIPLNDLVKLFYRLFL